MQIGIRLGHNSIYNENKNKKEETIWIGTHEHNMQEVHLSNELIEQELSKLRLELFKMRHLLKKKDDRIKKLESEKIHLIKELKQYKKKSEEHKYENKNKRNHRHLEKCQEQMQDNS